MKIRRFTHITTILLLIITALTTKAQSINIDGAVTNWEVGSYAALNTDGYEINLNAAYFPVQHIGIKTSIAFAGEIKQIDDWGVDDWESVHDYAIRFKFNPAIVLRTPRIISLKNQDSGFYLFAEPGIVLSPGAPGSRDAKYFAWDIKTGINLQLQNIILTLGYGISNFSLYSGHPYSQNGTPDYDNYKTHTGYIGISFKF